MWKINCEAKPVGIPHGTMRRSDFVKINKKKEKKFNGTSTHLLDGYNSANQIFFLHS